jgi:hypothetical protein
MSSAPASPGDDYATALGCKQVNCLRASRRNVPADILRETSSAICDLPPPS